MVEGEGEFDGANVGGVEQQELYQVNSMPYTDPINSNNSGYYSGTINKHTSVPHGHGSFALDYQKLPIVGVWKDGIMIQQKQSNRLSNASKEEGVNAGDDVSVMTGVTQQVSNTSTPTSGTTTNNKPSISVPVGHVNNSSLLLDDDDDDNEGEDMINQFKKRSSTGSNISHNSHNSSVPPRQSARMSNPHNLSLIQEEEISRRNLLDGSYRSQRSQRNMLDNSNRSSSRGLENALDNSARSGRNNMLAMSVGHTAAEDYTGEHDFRHSTGSFGGGHYYGDDLDEQWRKHGSQGSNNNVPSYYEQPDQYIDPSAYNDDIDASHRSTVSTTSSGQRRVSFKNDKGELRRSGKILSSNGKGLSPAQLIAQDSKSNTYLLDASGRSLAEIEALQQNNIAWGSSSSTGSTTPQDQQLLDRSSSSRTPWDNDEVTPTPEQIEALNKKNRWKIIPVSFGSRKTKKQKENKMQTLHSESITELQRRKRKYCIIALLLCMVIGGAAGVIYFLFYTKNVQEDIISDPSFNATNTTVTSQQPQDTLNDTTPEKGETISKLPWDDDTPCANLIISILTDKFGNETSWELFYDNPEADSRENVLLATDKRKRLRKHKASTSAASTTSRYLSETSMSNNSSSNPNNNDNDDNMTLILQSGPYKYLDTTDPTYISNISNQYSSQICLPMGQYKFIIHDKNNNGMCCMYGMGEYKGQFVDDGRVVFMGDGIFQNMDVQEFEVSRDDIVASMQLPTTTIVDEEDDGSHQTVTIPSTSPSFDPLSSNATKDISSAPTPAGSNDTLSSSSNNTTTTSLLVLIPGNLTFTNLIYPPETQEESDLMIVLLEDTIQDVAIKALTETDEDDDDESVRKVVIQEVKILGINGNPISDGTDKIPDEQDPQFEDDQVRYLQTAANVTQSDINSTLVMFNLILEESCEVCVEEDFVNTTTTYYEDTITPYMNDQVANGSLTDILQDRVKQNSVYQSLNDTTTYNDLFEGVEIVDGEFNVTVVQSDFDYTTSSSLEDSIILDEVNETDIYLSTNSTSNVTGILNTTDFSSSNTTVFNDTNIPPGTSNVTTTSYYNNTDNSNSTTPILNSTDIEPSNSTSNLTTSFNDTVGFLNTTDTNSTTPFSCPDTLNQSSVINSKSTLYYEVVPSSSNTSSDINNNDIFCARLEVIDIEDGWIGIGFSPGGKMEGSQAIVGVPNDGIVQKYTLSGYYPGVMSDEKQTLQDTSISIDEEDGKTVMKFAKQMVEADEDEVPIIHDGENILLHAWGNSMLGYHTGKLSFVIDLSSNRTEVPSAAPSQSSAPTVYNPELSYSKSLLIEGFSNSSQYGRDIDYSDGILAVGAPVAVNEVDQVTGAVYLYTLDSFISNDTASAEGENATVMPPQPFNIFYGVSPESSFGSSVALSSKHLVVGARNEDNETGVVRIYDIIDTDTVVMSGEFSENFQVIDLECLCQYLVMEV